MTESVLLIGSGAREHALAYRLGAYNNRKVFVSPGNAGIARDFECISPPGMHQEAFLGIARRLHPELTVIGPEEPLVNGLVDAFELEGFPVLGPSKACALLEGSKVFMKDFCKKAGIPTASSKMFNKVEDAEKFLCAREGKQVIKADGLCAGKGVVIAETPESALEVVKDFLEKKRFGKASEQIIIEDFLEGEEVSVIALCDGQRAYPFAPVQDHKRLKNNHQGPNTGGMGAAGPLPWWNELWRERAQKTIFQPALRALWESGTPYRGFLYAGLMVNRATDSIQLLEFNVRFGDPEAQTVMFGTELDLYPYFLEVAKHRTLQAVPNWSNLLQPTATIIMASHNYPYQGSVPYPIKGILSKELFPQSHVFFSGVDKDPLTTELLATGGRVLSVSTRGNSMTEAIQTCYQVVEKIQFQGAHYRTDIGKYLLTH